MIFGFKKAIVDVKAVSVHQELRDEAERVYLHYFSYRARAYVRVPLRCFGVGYLDM